MTNGSMPISERLENVKNSLLNIVGKETDGVKVKRKCKETIQKVLKQEGFHLKINSNGSNPRSSEKASKFCCKECSKPLNGTIQVSYEGFTCQLTDLVDFFSQLHPCINKSWIDPQGSCIKSVTSEELDETGGNIDRITQQLDDICIEAVKVVFKVGQQRLEKTLRCDSSGIVVLNI